MQQVSVTSWQQKQTYLAEPGVFETFKAKALVIQGPNLLLASTDGLYNMARCGVVQPWTLDPAFVASAVPAAIAAVTWNRTVWALPIALSTSSVIYYNKALAPNGPSSDLLQFAVQATDCARRMALGTSPAALAGFFVSSSLLSQCENTAALRAVFDVLNSVAKSPCVALNNDADFAAGLIAFHNGPSSDLGKWERQLGRNLGVAVVPRLSFDGAAVDTRSLISVLSAYSSASNSRQAALDWANFASSRGQAGTWTNVGRLVSVHPGVLRENTASLAAVDVALAASWVQPHTSYWAGDGVTGGFVRAFSPVTRTLGGLLTDFVSLNAAITAACSCLNFKVCIT